MSNETTERWTHNKGANLEIIRNIPRPRMGVGETATIMKNANGYSVCVDRNTYVHNDVGSALDTILGAMQDDVDISPLGTLESMRGQLTQQAEAHREEVAKLMRSMQTAYSELKGERALIATLQTQLAEKCKELVSALQEKDLLIKKYEGKKK